MLIQNKYNFGDIVFIKTDAEQKERMVIAILASPQGLLQYQLACGDTTTWQIEMLISETKDVLKTVTA